MRSKLAIALVLLATASSVSTIGCHSFTVYAPAYAAQPGAPVSDPDLPLALTHYVFAKPGSDARQKMALPLAERLFARAAIELDHDRNDSALAAIRFATMLLRVNHVAPGKLSDAAVAVLDRAVATPAAEGDEGTALGLYSLWSTARPADARPKEHLASLEVWDASPKGYPSSLVSAAEEAIRRSDAYAYAIDHDQVAQADQAILRWMDQTSAFRDGIRTKQRFEDEMYFAAAALQTAGTRLAIDHLRDGDLIGAKEAVEQDVPAEYTPKGLAAAIGSLGEGGAHAKEVIEALLPELRKEHLEAPISDAILGISIAVVPERQDEPFYAEAVVRGLLNAGIGDAAPAIFARSLLGTEADPHHASAEDLGRALSLTAEAIRDYAEREMYDAARRTYRAAAPLLAAAAERGDVDPSPGEVETLMGLLEEEAGQPDAAGKLFEEAIATSGKNAVALAGKARLAARAGDLKSARSLADAAVAIDPHGHEPLVRADVLTLDGDLARRDGDVTAARKAYESALAVLSAAKSGANGIESAAVAERVARVLSHFADGATKEDEYVAIVESTTGVDARVLTAVELQRLARPMRAEDAKGAKEAFHRASSVLAGEDLVRVALLARAIEKRGGASADPEIEKTLANAAAKDDAAGRIAKFARGEMDASALIAKAGTDARAVMIARFAIALSKWAIKVSAKEELEAVAHGDLVGAIEADLANDLLVFDHAVVPGGVKVAGI